MDFIKLMLKIDLLPPVYMMTPLQHEESIAYSQEKDIKLKQLVQLLTADGEI
jgi:hypothetical protein